MPTYEERRDAFVARVGAEIRASLTEERIERAARILATVEREADRRV